jgi:hypothetical protein
LVAEQIRSLIEANRIRSSGRLPPEREMALQLGCPAKPCARRSSPWKLAAKSPFAAAVGRRINWSAI